jgi:hypothetical protein
MATSDDGALNPPARKAFASARAGASLSSPEPSFWNEFLGKGKSKMEKMEKMAVSFPIYDIDPDTGLEIFDPASVAAARDVASAAKLRIATYSLMRKSREIDAKLAELRTGLAILERSFATTH